MNTINNSWWRKIRKCQPVTYKETCGIIEQEIRDSKDSLRLLFLHAEYSNPTVWGGVALDIAKNLMVLCKHASDPLIRVTAYELSWLDCWKIKE